MEQWKNNGSAECSSSMKPTSDEGYNHQVGEEQRTNTLLLHCTRYFISVLSFFSDNCLLSLI